MAEHSPLPWRLGYADGDRAFVNAGSVTVCKADRTRNECDPNANAAFIVRCVNSHADLLAALKALVENDEINLWVGGNPNVTNRVVHQALDAIQKAEAPL